MSSHSMPLRKKARRPAHAAARAAPSRRALRSRIHDLPTEMQERILSYLRPREEYIPARTCKLWYNILRDRRNRRKQQKWYTPLSFFYGRVMRDTKTIWLFDIREYDCLSLACSMGFHRLLKSMIDERFDLPPSLYNHAIHKGRLRIVQTLCDAGVSFDRDHLRKCIYLGYEDILRHMLETAKKNPSCAAYTPNLLTAALQYSHTSIVKFLLEGGYSWYRDECLRTATGPMRELFLAHEQTAITW